MVDLVPCYSLEEVLERGERGQSDISLLPVENSIEGTVGRTLDLLVSAKLKISAEISIPINHLLLRKVEGFNHITRVVAHSQALLQCQKWLDLRLPSVPRLAVESNGVAAQMAQQDEKIVAIAGKLAQEKYDLVSLANDIQNEKFNRTRFAALGKFEPDGCGTDQTSIIVGVRDQVGAMHKVVESFAKNHVSLRRFESRPARMTRVHAWEYLFYIDLEGHINDIKVRKALDDVKENSVFFKNLGSYPLFEKLGLPSQLT